MSKNVAGLTMSKFAKMVNEVAENMDADHDYHEVVAISKELGATDEQADLVAVELGRMKS